MEDPFAYCERLVREGDKDRFLASLFAPAAPRNALLALYAFNLEIARVRERAREVLPGMVRLQWWREAIAGGAGEARAHPIVAALSEIIERFALPRAALIDLLDAREFDLLDEPMQTLADLERYAERTSSALIELAVQILGGRARHPPCIRPAGIAYAITGLMRALPLHAARRQLYVPLDLLDRHGARPEDVFAGKMTPELAAALAAMRAYARAHFEAYRRSKGDVSSALAPAFLAVELVPLYLDRLESARDPLKPNPVPQWRRQWVLWRASRSYSAAAA
jgi:phytoene synthase